MSKRYPIGDYRACKVDMIHLLGMYIRGSLRATFSFNHTPCRLSPNMAGNSTYKARNSIEDEIHLKSAYLINDCAISYKPLHEVPILWLPLK